MALSQEDADAVAEKLTESRRLHTEAKPKSSKTRRDSSIAGGLWLQAYNLRVEAHELDEAHEAPAWALERVPHAQMMAFYEFKLAGQI